MRNSVEHECFILNEQLKAQRTLAGGRMGRWGVRSGERMRLSGINKNIIWTLVMRRNYADENLFSWFSSFVDFLWTECFPNVEPKTTSPGSSPRNDNVKPLVTRSENGNRVKAPAGRLERSCASEKLFLCLSCVMFSSSNLKIKLFSADAFLMRC